MNPQPNNNLGIILAAIILAATHWYVQTNEGHKPHPVPPGPEPTPVVPDATDIGRRYVIGYVEAISSNGRKAAGDLESGKDPALVLEWLKTANTEGRTSAMQGINDAMNAPGDDQQARAKVLRELATGYQKAIGK